MVLSTRNAVSSNHFSPWMTPEVSILSEGAYNSSFLMIGSRFLYIGPLKRLLFEQLVSTDSCKEDLGKPLNRQLICTPPIEAAQKIFSHETAMVTSYPI